MTKKITIIYPTNRMIEEGITDLRGSFSTLPGCQTAAFLDELADKDGQGNAPNQ